MPLILLLTKSWNHFCMKHGTLHRTNIIHSNSFIGICIHGLSGVADTVKEGEIEAMYLNRNMLDMHLFVNLPGLQ